MLKRRIIPIELFENGRLVKSKKFSDKRDVGDPIRSTSIYSDQDADEILLLNIPILINRLIINIFKLSCIKMIILFLFKIFNSFS